MTIPTDTRFHRETYEGYRWGLRLEVSRSLDNSARFGSAFEATRGVLHDLTRPGTPIFTVYEGDTFTVTVGMFREDGSVTSPAPGGGLSLDRGAELRVTGFDADDGFVDRGYASEFPETDTVGPDWATSVVEFGSQFDLTLGTGGETYGWWIDGEKDRGNGSTVEEVKLLEVVAVLNNPFYDWGGASFGAEGPFDGDQNFVLRGTIRYVDLPDGAEAGGGGSGGGVGVVRGTAGPDAETGGPGRERFAMGGGDDSVRAGGGRDTLRGGPGADTLEGEGGRDLLIGQGGADDLWGGRGDDRLRGGAGEDRLFGGGGNDVLLGGGGGDGMLGGAGADRLRGNGGADLMDGGPGRDRLTGGPGEDAFFLYPREGRDVATDFTPGEDTLFVVDVAGWDDAALRVRANRTVVAIEGAAMVLQGVGRGEFDRDDVFFSPPDDLG